jgi:hypothetical protein
MTIKFHKPDEPEPEGIDYDDLDEAIQDANNDDEGRIRPLTLLYHLNKRGWTISRAQAHDYPRPSERLAVHKHEWQWGDGVIACVTCGLAYPTTERPIPEE